MTTTNPSYMAVYAAAMFGAGAFLMVGLPGFVPV